MVWDWIEPKTLPLARRIVARLDRRWHEVFVRPDRVVVVERSSAQPRSFYLLHQLEAFVDSLIGTPERGMGRQDVVPVETDHPAQHSVQPWRTRWQPREAARHEELTNEIARLHETVAILRRKRRQAEAERDEWERVARAFEAELLQARGADARGNGGSSTGAEKFRRAKTIVARLTHPDTAGATGLEARIREKLFQEFWAEFERIEAES